MVNLEAIRRYCEARLGDQVLEVIATERDHGAAHGIAIRELDGRLHAVAVEAGDTAEEVAATLLESIERRQATE